MGTTRVTAATAMVAMAACGAGADEADLARDRAEIRGGVDDTVDVAVVGIVDDMTGATCTGSLIAPDLVMTAQHCVARVMNIGPCTQGEFAAPGAPAAYHVTTKPVIGFNPSDFRAVAEVRIPPGTGFCGRDLALLRLATRVPTTEARSIAPRLAPAPVAAEEYSAVGYGSTDDNGTGSGTRRRRDGMKVSCVGAGCASTFLGDAEWRGQEGTCQGDSGGPALAGDGRVTGVLSRGAVGCTMPTYTTVASHAAWLVDEAVRAAGLGGYPPPSWTGVGPPIDAGVDAAIDAPAGSDAGIDDDPDDGGCSTGGGAGGGALLVLAGLLPRARRRRGA
jgi:hypothetical protein